LSVASGAFAEVLDVFFSQWALTPAERDVALMVLKGLENEQIAAARGSAVGTIRAQTTRIYAKAGVNSRAQLMSVFIEELLAERLVPAAPAGDIAGQGSSPRMAS
jgi:DNA-binding NarL/FixJ family response regulator